MRQKMRIGDEEVEVTDIRYSPYGVAFMLDGVEHHLRLQGGKTLVNGEAVEVHSAHNTAYFADGREVDFHPLSYRAHGEKAQQSTHEAPMPGRVVAVHVTEGEKVAKGAPLVTLEAMKLQLVVEAGYAGVVKAIGCTVGGLVPAGHMLVDVEAEA